MITIHFTNTSNMFNSTLSFTSSPSGLAKRERLPLFIRRAKLPIKKVIDLSVSSTHSPKFLRKSYVPKYACFNRKLSTNLLPLPKSLENSLANRRSCGALQKLLIGWITTFLLRLFFSTLHHKLFVRQSSKKQDR